MTKITAGADTVTVTVRFFAAARDAAGADSTVLALAPGATVTDALRELCGQSDKLTLVLPKCSFLCDGVAVRDPGRPLQANQTVDVLPPFAGG